MPNRRIRVRYVRVAWKERGREASPYPDYANWNVTTSLVCDGEAMQSFFDRFNESWEAMDVAALAASAGMVLLGTGMQAAVITTLRPIDAVPGYWPLFFQTAPLTSLITLMTAIFWPARRRTRHPRNDRELLQSIIRRGPSVFEIVLVIVVGVSAAGIAVWIGGLDVLNQPTLLDPNDVIRPLNIPIRVVNFFAKFYFAYGYDAFWSSIVVGVCFGAACRTLANVWGPRKIA